MKKIPLYQQIFIAMIGGFIIGSIAGDGMLTNSILKPIGTMFINLIKMLVVPLIFCSMVTSIGSMEDDFIRMGRIAGRAFIFYLATTALAVSIGLVVANVINPGIGISVAIPEITGTHAGQTGGLLATFMNTLVAIIPGNPVDSLAKGNVLQIILFALLFGIAVNMAGEKGKPVRVFFEGASEVMFKLTAMVLKVAPIGVFALMACLAGKFGLKVLLPLGEVILTCYIASIIHALLTVGSCVKLFGKISPLRFFKAVAEPVSFAYVSASSYATLPLSISACHKKLGVSKKIVNFVCPVGATINMDGLAIYEGVSAIFIAQAYGIDLNVIQYVAIVFTATLGSIGAAGVPGTGLIMISMVLASAGLPLEGLAIIAGIDRILDMASTATNVLGDCACALVVGRAENEVMTVDSKKS